MTSTVGAACTARDTPIVTDTMLSCHREQGYSHGCEHWTPFKLLDLKNLLQVRSVLI